MSATMESDLFSRYFAVPVRGQLEGAPVVTVDCKGYPVDESYLEDLKGLGQVHAVNVVVSYLNTYADAVFTRDTFT